MTLRVLSAFLVICLAKGIHGAPSPSREVDVVLVPNQPKLPVIIFEFKENDGDENESEENYSNETSTSTTPGTPTISPLQSDEDTEDSIRLSGPEVAKFNSTKARSRRAISSEDQHSTTEGPDDYSSENDTSSSSTLGPVPVSGELIVASEEDDNGTIFTRVSIFRVVAVPYNASGNSSEESVEDNFTTSTPAASTKGNPVLHHFKKRQAGGYGASDASDNGRALAPEALTANVTAPTYVGEMSSPAPMSATGGPTTAAAGGSTSAPAGPVTATTSAAPAAASASSASSPSASSSSASNGTATTMASASNGTMTMASASNGTMTMASASNGTTTMASAAAPTPAGSTAAAPSPGTTAAPVVVAAPAGPAGSPPPPASLTAVQSSAPPLLCQPPPPPQGSSPPAPPPPPSNLMQPTTPAPASSMPGGPRGLGY